MPAAALVIAADALMPSLRERLKVDGEILTYPDTEPIQALQMIMEQRPSLVVLERLFAATPRGAALINRIKSDPQLAHVEVRVMSHTGDYTRQVVKPTAAKAPTPSHGTSATATAPEPTGGGAVATEEAPRAALSRPLRDRTAARRQSCGRDRSVNGRRASHLSHRAASEPEGPHRV